MTYPFFDLIHVRNCLNPEGTRRPEFICQHERVEIGLFCPGALILTGSMHEFSIMESALQIAAETARDAQAKRVHVVRMRVGTLSGAVPEALEFAFEALAPGTLVEGARIEIISVPAKFWCASCQKEFEAQNMLAQCPVCFSPSSDLRSGRELEVASLEID